MNALDQIQEQAKVIVEQLAERQINGMKERYNQFNEWMSIEGNPVMDRDRVDEHESVTKYIYMTQYKNWNHVLQQYELPTHYPDNRRERREMFRNKDLAYATQELHMQRGNWENNYRNEFIGQNMVKLNRALAKYINNEMSASDIRVNMGGDGAEVLADVDGKLFKTFGTLCGGWVQCLHYRYRSSLK